MSTGLDQEFKERVRAATDIVALIGESHSLQARRGGREFVCLCPFHNDTNPSLTVSPERQSYKCWSCLEGGDCFSWVMKQDGLDFFGALKLLAERAGLEMPARYTNGNPEDRKSKQSLLEVLSWAEAQFHKFLLEGKAAEPARAYLAERGFTDETIQHYRLGFHPPEWEWLLSRARGRYEPEQLKTAWLAGERNGGNGYYDNFFGRVMFPVRDERGRVVAFGGRVLPALARENDAKYINSADTPLFSKSRLLYGLDVAREAVRQTDEAVVVEGYTDCIMCSQSGIENAVAILGTALTEQHVQLLRRFCRKVVLVLDGDAAGQNAAVRSLGKFLAHDVDLRILPLPAGSDPADFLADNGADAFRELATNAVEAWEFKLQASINTHTLESMDSRHRVLVDMLDLLRDAPRLAGTVREDLILSRVSRILQIPESKVRSELRTARRQPSNPSVSINQQSDNEQTTSPIRTPDDRLECELLEMIFADPQICGRVLERVSVEEFRHSELQLVYGTCRDLWEQDVPPSYERVMTVLESPSLKRLATEIEDLSRRQKIAEKLQTAPLITGAAPPPSYFDDVVARFDWRRRQETAVPQPHAGFNGHSGDAGLTAEKKAQLRDLTDLRNADPTHHRTKPQTGRPR